jgi:hypothetical protein
MSKKQSFVRAATKKRLKHYQVGGMVAGSGPTSAQGLLGSVTPQSSYQATLAPQTQYGGYLNAIQNAQGQALGAIGGVTGQVPQMQNLENVFLQQMAGQGPNPAQQQLAANTSANIAAQSAMAAGQRGAAGNVGLMQRNVAQQGAATQQQAAGQASTLQAQQEITAAQNAAAQQQAINQAYAQQAGLAGQMYGTALGGMNTQNANQIANYQQAQGINASTSMQNAQMFGGMLGGLAGGGGSALTALLAEGGEVKPQQMPEVRMADGGFSSSGVGQSALGSGGPAASFAGAFLSGKPYQVIGGPSGSKPSSSSMPNADFNQPSAGYQTLQQSGQLGMGPTAPGSSAGIGSFTDMAKGGNVSTKKVEAMVSPDEVILNKQEAKSPNAPAIAAEKVKKGDKVHGKAKVSGDSLKNDTVHKKLEEGGIVVKRTAAQSPSKAAKFVQHVKAAKRR